MRKTPMPRAKIPKGMDDKTAMTLSKIFHCIYHPEENNVLNYFINYSSRPSVFKYQDSFCLLSILGQSTKISDYSNDILFEKYQLPKELGPDALPPEVLINFFHHLTDFVEIRPHLSEHFIDFLPILNFPGCFAIVPDLIKLGDRILIASYIEAIPINSVIDFANECIKKLDSNSINLIFTNLFPKNPNILLYVYENVVNPGSNQEIAFFALMHENKWKDIPNEAIANLLSRIICGDIPMETKIYKKILEFLKRSLPSLDISTPIAFYSSLFTERPDIYPLLDPALEYSIVTQKVPPFIFDVFAFRQDLFSFDILINCSKSFLYHAFPMNLLNSFLNSLISPQIYSVRPEKLHQPIKYPKVNKFRLELYTLTVSTLFITSPLKEWVNYLVYLPPMHKLNFASRILQKLFSLDFSQIMQSLTPMAQLNLGLKTALLCIQQDEKDILKLAKLYDEGPQDFFFMLDMLMTSKFMSNPEKRASFGQFLDKIISRVDLGRISDFSAFPPSMESIGMMIDRGNEEETEVQIDKNTVMECLMNAKTIEIIPPFDMNRFDVAAQKLSDDFYNSLMQEEEEEKEIEPAIRVKKRIVFSKSTAVKKPEPPPPPPKEEDPFELEDPFDEKYVDSDVDDLEDLDNQN